MASVSLKKTASEHTSTGWRRAGERLASTSALFWFWAVLGVGAGLRLFLLVTYSPVAYGDTPSYRRIAGQLMQGLDYYEGTRTPGYPLFLALVGDDQRVWIVQMLLGLLTALLLFYIGWQISGRPWLGGLTGIAHSLNLGQLFFEADLLSETLTAFLVVAVFAGLCLFLYHPGWRTGWKGILLAALVSLLSGLAFIVRPLFIFLPVWLALFLALQIRFEPSETPAKPRFKLGLSLPLSAAGLLPGLLIVLGWMGMMKQQFGDFSPTTMTGYHLVQHSGVFFEYVPDEYADLRDTYIRYRDAHIAKYGTQTNTIWDAIPELQKVTGKSFYDLSRLLARISVRLILSHPDLYLKNVCKGWWYFWRVPVYWKAEAFRWPALAAPVPALVLAERLALIASNLFFVTSSVMIAAWAKARRVMSVPAALWCLAGLLWATSVLQTLLDHGDNVRFLVPLQSLVVVWCVWVVWKAAALRTHRQA